MAVDPLRQPVLRLVSNRLGPVPPANCRDPLGWLPIVDHRLDRWPTRTAPPSAGSGVNPPLLGGSWHPGLLLRRRLFHRPLHCSHSRSGYRLRPWDGPRARGRDQLCVRCCVHISGVLLAFHPTRADRRRILVCLRVLGHTPLCDSRCGRLRLGHRYASPTTRRGNPLNDTAASAAALMLPRIVSDGR